MHPTFRIRLLLMLLPFVVLVAALGAGGVWLLHRLGSSIDDILRENYHSVVAMQHLRESLERIDSSLQFMIVAREIRDPKERKHLEDKARKQYSENWRSFEESLVQEENNITIHPAEDELVARLKQAFLEYKAATAAFFNRATLDGVRNEDYYGDDGLYGQFVHLNKLATNILDLNQAQMRLSSFRAKETANSSLFWFCVCLAVSAFISTLLVIQTARAVLSPIRAMTWSAREISSGNLDQVIPVTAEDELGALAQAFNTMARNLRDFRHSQSAQLLRAQRTSQATIDSFPDPVLVIDTEGRVEMANPAARQLLGVVPRSADQPTAGLWAAPEALQEPLAAVLRGHRNYLPESFDKVLLFGSGGVERALLPRILTIRDPYGAALGAAIVLQDVSRFRLLDQIKTNLVATTSHELKTALTSVQLAVHLLLEEATGPLSPKQTELLLDARDNSERLLATVNNLLDLARLEQGYQQLNLHSQSPDALIQSAAEAFAPRARDKHVDIEVAVEPGLPKVNVDGPRFDAALRNLIENAINYTDPGDKVTLSASCHEDKVALNVTDTGIGIPAEYLPHLFDKFSRVPGQSRGSGTGLGLAIVREIVTAHGGTISCESQPGAGTTFRITLPATQ